MKDGFLIAISLIQLTLASSVWAAPCGGELRPQLSLPRELKLSAGAAEYLMQSDEHRWLLESMSRIFSVFDDPDFNLSEVTAAIGEEPDQEDLGASDIQETDLYRRRPALVDESVQANYITLSETELKSRLSPNDLAVMAYLLKGVPRHPKSPGENLYQDPRRAKRELYAGRVKTLVSNPDYSVDLATIFLFPRMRMSFIEIWEDVAPAGMPEMDYDRLNEIVMDILRGRSDDSSRFAIRFYLDLLAVEIGQFGKTRGLDVGELKTSETYERTGFLQALYLYFAEVMHLKMHLNTLVSTMDFYLFGTPLPMPEERLWTMAVDASKALLLPLKGEYMRFQSNRQKNVAPVKSSETFEFKPIDYFKPKASPYIRTAAKAGSDVREEAESRVADLESQIPAERALRAFTTFSAAPRDLSELSAHQSYEFWFLRANEPAKESIRFSTSVIDWFNENPETARAFLNALHMGRARISGQSGIKQMMRRSPHHPGAVYEVKIPGALRGLMLLVNGEWQFISVVTKNEQDRAVGNLEPL